MHVLGPVGERDMLSCSLAPAPAHYSEFIRTRTSRHIASRCSKRRNLMNMVQRALLGVALIAPAAIVASPAAAAERHYDCFKPGNANKAACKGGAAAPAAKATPARTTTTAVTTKTTTRQYDCTKKGNANKAACKTAASQTSSGTSAGAVKTTTKTTATTTDCSKWYNKARAVCRTSSSSTPTKTTVAPAPKPAVTSSSAPSARSSAGGENNNPNGATAQCKDGTYSHAAHHAGACSRHGGVAKWM